MTVDIASLGISVDTRQVKEGAANLDRLTEAGGKAEDATNRLANAAKRYENSLLQSKGVSENAQRQTQSYIAALERQVALHGKSTAEALRYDASLLGMTQSQAKHVDELIKTAQAQERSSEKTSLLTQSLKLLAAAYASLKVVDYIKDATLLQARYETLGVAMTVVGRNAGFTSRQMEEAAIGLQKTGISMIESRAQILKLVQAQIDLSEASKLARIAQDAAVIGNVNSSEAFARMIHGIQTGQPEVLRMLGLNVSMEQSYKEMAKSLGINTNQLTQQQKTQAVLNSVMREGAAIAGTYEAAMGTAGKQLNSMQRYTENLKVVIGETFNEGLIIAVEAATKGLKGMNDQAKDLAVDGKLREWGRDAVRVAAIVIDAFRLIKNTFVQAGNGLTFLAQAAKLALTGQFAAIKELSAAQEKENAEFVKNITLVSDTVKERFALLDRERANAAARADAAGNKPNKPTQDLLGADADAIKRAEAAYKNLIQSIQEKIAVQSAELALGRSLTDSEKTSLDVMVKLRDGELKLTDAKKMRLVAELENLSAMERSVAAAEFARKASDDLIQSGQRQVKNLQEQVTAQREQNAMIGMTNEQVIALTGARNLEMAANLRNAAAYAGPLHNAYLVYASDLEKVARLQKDLVTEQQIAKNAEQWTRIGQTIEQTGKTAFIQFAAHGLDAVDSVGQAIKLMLVDTLYQLTARKWTINIVTSIQSSLASGAANAAGSILGTGSNLIGGLASGARGLLSAFTGGAGRLATSFGTSSLGQLLGLGATSSSVFGAGVGTAGAGAGTAFIGGAGTALGGTGTAGVGLTSMGSMLAAAAGPLAIAAAADVIFRLIAGNKTVGGTAGKVLNYVPVIGPLINGLFGAGPKKLGPAELTGFFSESGFSGEFQADWTRKRGIFSSAKKSGRRGLGIDPEFANNLGASVDTSAAVYHELLDTIGAGERTLSGWTFAVKQQVETEEQMAKLATDLSNSIGKHLVPELEKFQQKGEELADTASRLRAEFILVDELLDLTGMTLNTFGVASLKTRDSLVQLLGGLDSASQSLNSFYQNFYTEEERVASASRILTKELNKLGVSSIPVTIDQYRQLVEAQDLNTASGQAAFASLIQLAPMFATVANAATKAATDLEAEAKRIRDSFKLLTTDSFKDLFEYTRYIRKAANAGVTAAQPDNIYLPSFDVGSNELPRDMVARVHKGERIIPASDNSKLMQKLSQSDSLAEEIRSLREDAKAQSLAIARNTSATAKFVEKMTKVLEQWDGGLGAAATRTL